MSERLVVIGGDAAGMSAASQARRLRGADDLEIVAFERGRHTSYAACGIPYFVGGVVEDLERLVARSPEEFRRRQEIDARVGHEVTEVDLERCRVRVRDVEARRESWEGFDQLMIATGSVPLRPPIPGVDAEGVFGVQTLDDGFALAEALRGWGASRAVVVGGGYIGLEMAEAMCLRGLHVSLVEQAAHPMTTLDPDMGGLISDAMRSMGVDVYEGEAVVAFEQDNGRVTAVTTRERTLPTDIVVLGLGVRPDVALARQAGITTGIAGGIIVDRRMATESPGVWAAGDCVESFHRVSRRAVVIALGTHANKQGRVAGINIGGGYATFPGVVGTAVSKICEYEVARTGLREVDAAAAGFRQVSVTIESTTRAGYYPGASPIRVKIIAERGSGRLLGAQIIGKEGAAKRIDVLAAALWNEMTVEEMLSMDLSYAPPFAPVWDPVLIAARKAAEAVADGQLQPG